MQTSCIRNGLIAFCLVVSPVLVSQSLAENGTPSVLSRVQTVDDPELGELLRAALEQPKGVDDQLKTTRAVTESYAKIKLLDRQIEEAQQRIKSVAGPAELRHELVLAAAELESRRVMELANLREVMGIIPKHAFGRTVLWNLKTWLHLDVLDNRVYVLESVPPFSEDQTRMTYRAAGMMSPEGALDYIAQWVKDSQALPIRVDIHRMAQGISLSEQLKDRIVELIRKANLEMQAEVHLVQRVQPDRQTFTLEVRGGEIREQHWAGGRARGSTFKGISGTGATEYAGYIRSLLMTPEYVPATFRVVYTPQSSEAAKQCATGIEEAAKSLGIQEFVEVVQTVDERLR
jgi:hypothetical protein